MDTRRIADRLLSRLLGTGKALVSARRRALATNGTDQERRALVKQPELEGGTLEILARRGPDDVTMAVARHPDLQLETARSLLRMKNPAFASALQNRFGDSLDLDSRNAETFSNTPESPAHAASDFEVPTPQPDPTVTDPIVTCNVGAVSAEPPQSSNEPSAHALAVVSAAELTAVATGTAPSVQPVIADTADSKPYPVTEIKLPTSTEPASPWSLEDFTPQVPLGTDSPRPDASQADSEQLPDTDDELDFLSAVEEFEHNLDRLAPLLGHDLADASVKPRARTDRYDEAAEIRFLKAFQRIPDGHTGERLLSSLSLGANAPKFHKLLELYRAGLNVDELAVAWTVRETWNTVNSDRYTISYRSIGAIVRSFAGTPDPEEVLQLLGMLRDNFHLMQARSTRFFYRYAEELADGFEASERAGQYLPLDMLAVARNYR